MARREISRNTLAHTLAPSLSSLGGGGYLKGLALRAAKCTWLGLASHLVCLKWVIEYRIDVPRPELGRADPRHVLCGSVPVCNN